MLKKLIILLLFASSANAVDLGLPLACNYGKDCFISNYFDHDAAPKISKDLKCSNMSIDGYKNTDFILKNNIQMKEGVNVIAGDTGIVKMVRDGITDVSIELSGTEAVRGRECGNGVIIEHKRGYETQYCHLKKGSIVVKPGDRVEKGQNIGEVGMSGLSSFPFLEFTVRLHGNPIDPFTGEDPVTGVAEIACDSLDIYPLWDKPTEKTLTYIPTALLSSGFSTKVPNANGARDGKYSSTNITSNTRLITFWIDILGIKKNDSLKISIVSPKGEEISSNTKEFNTDKRHLFQFIGSKPEKGNILETGEYVGKVELFRLVNGQKEQIMDARNIIEVVE